MVGPYSICRADRHPRPLTMSWNDGTIRPFSPPRQMLAVQANFGLLVNCVGGLRVLEASKMTQSKHLLFELAVAHSDFLKPIPLCAVPPANIGAEFVLWMLHLRFLLRKL
jgi:hypothetical protein